MPRLPSAFAYTQNSTLFLEYDCKHEVVGLVAGMPFRYMNYIAVKLKGAITSACSSDDIIFDVFQKCCRHTHFG